MKKAISLIITICLLIVALPVSAASIELDPLKYDSYMFGETLTVKGTSDAYFTLGLYYPEEAGGTAKFIMTYSPSELRSGIAIALGEGRDWPEGTWTIVVQAGEAQDSVEFYLTETVDRTEEPDDSSKPDSSGNSGTTTVTSIIPDKTSVTLKVGQSETVSITTTASSLTLEVEDEDIIDASLSGKTVTIKALKKGSSDIWVRTGNNYATIKVTVKSSGGNGGISRDEETERPTEKPTEEVTEPVTEPATEETTEPATEESTEPAEKEIPFTDINGHWAEESISYLYSKGIINGMTETTFAPDANVTRAQFVTMLCNAFKLTTTSNSSPFNDVSEDDWYFRAVITAYENGIAQGDYSQNFNPNSLVTRQDMAVFAFRAATNSGISLLMTAIQTFSDHAGISDYAIEAVYSMKSAGIINGMTETTFEPKGTATRAQAAHIIAQLIKSVN